MTRRRRAGRPRSPRPGPPRPARSGRGGRGGRGAGGVRPAQDRPRSRRDCTGRRPRAQGPGPGSRGFGRPGGACGLVGPEPGHTRPKGSPASQAQPEERIVAAVAGSAGRGGVRRRRARDNHRRTTRRVMRALQRHTPADRTPAACGCVAGVAARRAERAVRADTPLRGRPGRRCRRAAVVRRGGAPKLHMLSQTLGEPGIVSAEHRPDLILERKPPDSRQRPPVQRRQRLRRPLLNLRMRGIKLSLIVSS